jgi:hypothetical protein
MDPTPAQNAVRTIAATAVGVALLVVLLAAGRLAGHQHPGTVSVPAVGRPVSPIAVAQGGTPIPAAAVAAPANRGFLTLLVVASAVQAAAVQAAMDAAAPLLVSSGSAEPNAVFIILDDPAATPSLIADATQPADLIDLRLVLR